MVFHIIYVNIDNMKKNHTLNVRTFLTIVSIKLKIHSIVTGKLNNFLQM